MLSRIATVTGIAVATTALVAGAAAAEPAGPAEPPPGGVHIQGSCGDTLDPSISAGRAHWTLTCSGGQITMKGYVKDTSPDNECVGVKGKFAGGETETRENCKGWGESVSFSWTHPGSLADGYLYNFDD